MRRVTLYVIGASGAPILGVHCSYPGRWFPLVLSFVALGYFLTEEWASIEMRLQHDIGIFVGVGLVTILVYITIYFWLRRKQVRAAISQENQENEAELDPVEEASRESFPASDPPSWVMGRQTTQPRTRAKAAGISS